MPHLCELANDAVALPAAVTHELPDGVLAEDDLLVCADLHAQVGGHQNVQPSRAWQVLGHQHALGALLVVHLEDSIGQICQ